MEHWSSFGSVHFLSYIPILNTNWLAYISMETWVAWLGIHQFSH